jgi:hypothetical protein
MDCQGNLRDIQAEATANGRADFQGSFQLSLPILQEASICQPAPKMATIPDSLKPIQPFLRKSDEMKVADPVVSYYCILTFIIHVN